MSSGDTEFIDITGGDASLAPLVHGGLRAYYLTGSGGIAETPTQITAARAAGMGVVLIDQTPGGQPFAAGLAQVYDIEALAGTPASAAAACHARTARGITEHTLYESLSELPALRSAVAGIPGVCYGVADYSWSLAEAETYIAANDDVVYAQFGDPGSNPGTLIPGTNVTLSQANADIDVARAAWAAQFLPGAPAPAPAPAQEVYTMPELQQGTTGYAVGALQGALSLHPVGVGIVVDGDFGPDTSSRLRAFQSNNGLTADGVAGPLTYAKLI